MTASTVAPRREAGESHAVSGLRVFARSCAAEWTRLWSVRATWWFLAIAVVVMIGLGTIVGFEAAGGDGPPDDETAWLVSAIATMLGQFALLALALIAVTSDYATGGIVPALQWAPRRTTFLLARTAVVAVATTTLGVLLALGAALAAWTAGQSELALPAGAAADALGTVAFVVGAGALLAIGLGFTLRNTAGGLVAGFLTMVVLPVFLPQFGYTLLTEIAQVLPGSAAAFLLLGEVPGMTTTSSTLVLLSWSLGVALLGWLRLTRADANH